MLYRHFICCFAYAETRSPFLQEIPEKILNYWIASQDKHWNMYPATTSGSCHLHNMLPEEGKVEEESNKGDQMHVEWRSKIRGNIIAEENWEEREGKCIFKQNAFWKEAWTVSKNFYFFLCPSPQQIFASSGTHLQVRRNIWVMLTFHIQEVTVCSQHTVSFFFLLPH